MTTVTIKRSASYDIIFPDGSEITMRQLGAAWEGMIVLVDDSGQRLILDTGTYDMERFISNLFGGDDDKPIEAKIIKGAPGLLVHMQKSESK